MAEPAPVLLTCYSLEAGGTERQLTEMAKALDRTRFAPRVACFRKVGLRVTEVESAGVPVIEFPVRSFRSPRTLAVAAQAWRYCRAERIRICHSFDVPTGGFFAPIARAAGVRTVLTSQRAYRTMFPADYQRLIRWSDRVVDGIVVNCEAMRRHLVKDEGLAPQRIHVCYNGLDPERFTPGDRSAGRPPVIGTISALRPEKSIETLIEAAHRAGVPLRIVGSGSEKGALERRAAQLGVTCEFISEASDVERWYRSLDVFVLASRTEALSNSLMEAMACGCCVIASRVGGTPELVEHGVTGLLFEAGDAAGLAEQLQRAIEQPEQRRAMGISAAQFVRSELTIEQSVKRLEEIYSAF